MNLNTDVINKLVDAYNASNARVFANFFAADVCVYEHSGQLVQSGREEIFDFYVNLFKQFPENRTKVLHRIVIGDRVIDHEQVRRYAKSEPFEVLAIYEMQDGFIQRFDLVRK